MAGQWRSNTTVHSIVQPLPMRWRERLAPWRNWLAGAALLLFFTGVAAVFELGSQYAHYAALVDARLADRSLQQPPGIYAAPRRVSVGQPLTVPALMERLRASGYLSTAETSDFAAGNFALDGSALVMRTNEFAQSAARPARVRIEFGPTQVRAIRDEDTGKQLPSILLPPELLTADFRANQQRRRALSYEEIPAHLVRALCAIEDRRFFSHSGLDGWGILRAAWANLRHGEVRQGGSTLTQQLVKNEFLTPARTWERKLAEALLALALERRLTKEQILTLYCERVYLGQRALTAVYGFRQAAAVYFGKELREITAAEAAFLAGLVKAPNRYVSNQADALARRNLVLDAMCATGALSAPEAAASKTETVALQAPPSGAEALAPWFIDYINRELAAQQLNGPTHTRLRVETTLDLDLQQAAQQVLSQHLRRLQKLVARRNQPAQPEAALVALNPQTGEILAMLGGSNYATSQLNRATDARRQPGSVFKPVVYAAALTRGFSPATTFTNAPHDINFGYKAVYRPENFRRSYSYQPVTLREALVRSLNVVAVEAAMETGLGHVARLAEQMGLPRPAAYPSLALGAFEATPLEIAQAYTTFANYGVRVDPLAVRTVRSGAVVLYQGESSKATLLPATTAYLVTDALIDVVNRGTGARIRQMGYRGPAAGKTGTSRDAWYVGYTPKLVVVVWVGFDDHRDLKLTGGEAAAPIWADFIKQVLALRPDLAASQFAKPTGLESVEIDPTTGGLANPYCPQRQRVLTARYLTPEACQVHHEPPQIMEALFTPLELTTAGETPPQQFLPALHQPAATEPEDPSRRPQR
jgi:penicillin-binding protein 1B